uniref:Uncharacterized protein n=1 Tax=Salmo trutta TaxID=8032 RepID=A0A673WN40_SALTR
MYICLSRCYVVFSGFLNLLKSFLELFLASLHGQILSLIQAVLQVLDCDLQVLLHPLQVRTVAQLDLHLVQISLHLLLHPQGIIPAPDLRVQGALHGVNHPLAVPLDLLHLLILLSDLPVHLTLDLVQLQLHTQNLGFLVLQCSLDKQKQSGQLCYIYIYMTTINTITGIIRL